MLHKMRIIMFSFAIGLIVLPSSVGAQTVTPAGKSTLADNIAALGNEAGQLMNQLNSEVFLHLLGWFENISVWLAVFILIASFLRLWRENNGASWDLMWWCVRLGIILALIGTSGTIIDTMREIGKGIAVGQLSGSSGGDSLLYNFYSTQRSSFNQSYQKFSVGNFTVNVNGDDVPVKPANSPDGALLGVLFDHQSAVTDIDKDLDVSKWNMSTLFGALSFSRGVVEFADLYLILLSGFVVLGLKLAAPFMLVAAIDRSMANKITYPFAWGVVVFTIIWPIVAYLIRGLAYLAGNLALALGDSSPVYKWDPNTLQAIKQSGTEPVYTIVIACVVMLVSGLVLFFSPVVAYKISMGQVYEGVSSTVSGWMAGIVGTGVSFVSAQAGASIARQAEVTQAQGAYSAETTRAGGSLEAGNLGVKARQISAIAGARGSQVQAVGQIYAARTQAVMSAQAQREFGVSTAQAANTLAKGETAVGTQQGISDLRTSNAQRLGEIEVNRGQDTRVFVGDKVHSWSTFANDALQGATGGKEGTPLWSKAVGGTIEAAGTGVQQYQQYTAIQRRASGTSSVVSQGTDGHIQNQSTAASGHYKNQDAYLSSVTQSQDSYRDSLITAADTSAGQAAGAVNQGTNVVIKGINESAGVERQANQVTFDSQMKAAEVTRSSSVEAARLRAMSTVISSIGYQVGREVESAMALHY